MLRSVEYAARATFNLKTIKAFIEQENPAAALQVVVFTVVPHDLGRNNDCALRGLM